MNRGARIQHQTCKYLTVSGRAWRKPRFPPAHPDEHVSSLTLMHQKAESPRLPAASFPHRNPNRTGKAGRAGARHVGKAQLLGARRCREPGRRGWGLLEIWAWLGWTGTGPESQDDGRRPEEDGEHFGRLWVFSAEELMVWGGISCDVRWSLRPGSRRLEP